jgi:hypothetical protein
LKFNGFSRRAATYVASFFKEMKKERITRDAMIEDIKNLNFALKRLLINLE